MGQEKFVVRSRVVYTGDKKSAGPAALVIQGKKIQAVLPWDYDKTDEGKKYVQYPLVDYGDKLVMPSFMDAHTHLFKGAVNASEYVCDTMDRCKSIEECAEMIYQYYVNHPELDVIRGSGWFLGNFKEPTFPDKRILDELIPDKPVYLFNADCHSMWLNSKALAAAGLDDDYCPKQGEAVKFADGSLTGFLVEPEAYAPAEKKYMEFTDEQLLTIIENFQQVLAEKGICAVSEMFADDYDENTYRLYGLIKKLDEEHKLKSHIFSYTRLFGYTDFTEYFKLKKAMDSEHFHIAGVKGFIDGVTETHTGLLLKPYTDSPDTKGEGVPFFPQEKMQAEISAANAAGIQVRLHCIADGSVRMALDMYEKAQKECGRDDLLNTVEHIENIHPDDIGRFAQLNVIASMQPYHLTLSNNDKIIALGKERCQYEWAIKTLLEAKAQIAFGTDYPVIGIDPFVTIYTAYTRKDDNGEYTGQNPWEKIGMYDIINNYTKIPAKVYHTDECMGSLEAGKDADFIVLDQNIFDVSEDEIKKTRVLFNYFEGGMIYGKE